MLRCDGGKGSGDNFKASLSIKISNLISRQPYATLCSLEWSETLVKGGLFGHLIRPSDIFNIFYRGNNRVDLHGDAAVAVVAKNNVLNIPEMKETVRKHGFTVLMFDTCGST